MKATSQELHDKDIRSRLPGYLSPRLPTTYTLELTATCNHHCIGCGNVFEHKKYQLSAASWLSLLEKIPQRPLSLRLTGGEPTLHPEFYEIVRQIDALAIPYTIFTNGRWRDSQALLNFFASCSHLDGLLISLHGNTPERHAAFTGTDSFDEVCHNIELAASQGIRVGTNTLLLNTSLPYLNEIASLCLGLGASSVHFSRYYGPILEGLEPEKEPLHDAILKIAEMHKHFPRVLLSNCVPACFSDTPELTTRGCTSGFTHAVIDPWGNVRPCTHSPIVVGNLFEQSMHDIWDSAPLWDWRARILDECFTCLKFYQCRGGCRATAYHRDLLHDPLISLDHLAESKPGRSTVHIQAGAHLKPNYSIYNDQQTIYVVNRNRHIPITPKALPILEALNGEITMREIQERYGSAALDFIGTLAAEGLITISYP